MKKNSIEIDESNIGEWLSSVGYFLPTSELELQRFELLYPKVERTVSDSLVDPFAILNGIWKPTVKMGIVHEMNFVNEIQELRLAARNHAEIPPDIIAKMKKNQADNDSENNIQSPK